MRKQLIVKMAGSTIWGLYRSQNFILLIIPSRIFTLRLRELQTRFSLLYGTTSGGSAANDDQQSNTTLEYFLSTLRDTDVAKTRPFVLQVKTILANFLISSTDCQLILWSLSGTSYMIATVGSPLDVSSYNCLRNYTNGVELLSALMQRT